MSPSAEQSSAELHDRGVSDVASDSSPRTTVLLVEDSPSLARVYLEYLRDEPFDVVHADTGKDALTALREKAPPVVLLDLKLPDMDGMEILRHVRDNRMSTAVVVITAHGSINVAVDAMRGGAFDFLVKPFNAERLVFTLRNALERQRLTRIVETYEEDIVRRQYGGFIGSSLAMQAVYRIIDGAASSRATVFITGESGTGKEICAEAVHERSPRKNAPFVAINCAAIPKDLIESEIFGHVKGAFTGALEDREGAAARADGGTLFLDEICDMDINLQSKLLRFIQTGSFLKVGGNKTEKVDVRFICATNRDPLKAVEAGEFREDLYYRLHVIPIYMPPLRERGNDVLEIARAFLAAYAGEEGRRFRTFTAEAEAKLLAYSWPGNVRQLQNIVRNVVVLNDGEVVSSEMLPPPLRSDGSALLEEPMATAPDPMETAEEPPDVGGLADAEQTPPPLVRPLWQIERDTIEAAIRHCDGNIPRAAALLEVSPSTIYRKRQAWAQNDGDETDAPFNAEGY